MKYFRAVFRFSAFAAATLALYAVWFVRAPFVQDSVLWRQTVFGLWAQAFKRIAKMRVRVAGTPPTAPFFLVSNHLSYADIPLLRFVVAGDFVAKGEIEGWFLAGRICRDMGVIFINRQNRRDIPRAGGEIIERLNQGEGVIVFPEGTSSRGETVLPFNSSFLEFAAKRDLPVSYAAISYETPAGEMRASDAICWWQDFSLVRQMFLLFELREFTATINFGDEPVSSRDRKTLARELNKRVIERFTPVE
jgi:1-acyl-sn-glycerol-3-phosphate acyltransferase